MDDACAHQRNCEGWFKFLRFAAIVFALAAPALYAFDSCAWLEKRAAFGREAELLRAAYSNCFVRVSEAAQDLVIPVESYSNGTIKASISAKRAQFFLQEDLVWAEGVVMRQYAPDGVEITAELRAKSAIVNRKRKCAWAEGPAQIVVSGTKASGENIYFSFPAEFVKIFSKVEIVSSDLNFEGVKL